MPSVKSASMLSEVPTTMLPSSKPSHVSSDTPSHFPSDLPSVNPSDEPSNKPSSRPTSLPSRNPTNTPSSSPSLVPTLDPSFKPSTSLKPSHMPSFQPSLKFSERPSSPPSTNPSSSPSHIPTTLPSSSPSLSLLTFEFTAKMSVDNCDILGDRAIEVFENVTSTTIETQLYNKFGSSLKYLEVLVDVLHMMQAGFGEFAASETSIKSESAYNGNETIVQPSGPVRQLLRKRGLESGFMHRIQKVVEPDLLVMFNLVVSVRSPIDFNTMDMQNYVLATYDSPQKEIDYIYTLQTHDREVDSFESINRVAIWIDGEPIDPDPDPPSQETRGIVFYGLIGAGALIVVVFAFFLWRRSNTRGRFGSGNGTPMSFLEADDFDESQQTPDIASEIQVNSEDQEISTLGDPHQIHNQFGNNQSMSIGGLDFNRMYGGAAANVSVSTAAGKQSAESPYLPLRSKSNSINDTVSSLGQSSMDQENVSLFTDEGSFDRSNNGDKHLIEVVAPPGKLGVVIDTPLAGTPMVYAIKDTSVLADQVRIGDRLISVDGEDTTQLSAINVSMLISSKARYSRVLVFERNSKLEVISKS